MFEIVKKNYFDVTKNHRIILIFITDREPF